MNAEPRHIGLQTLNSPMSTGLDAEMGISCKEVRLTYRVMINIFFLLRPLILKIMSSVIGESFSLARN